MEDGLYVATQWQSVCRNIGVTSVDWMADEWEKIRTAYTGVDRHYHDIGHIAYVLRMIEEYRSLADDVMALRYAAIRHDEVYLAYARPKGLATIEVMSACVADDALARLNDPKLAQLPIRMDFRQRVVGIINVTHHNAKFWPQTYDEMLMGDVDWSPMGASWSEFLRNRKNIRKEYSAYSDSEFIAGRRAFLSALDGRATFFHLDEFKDRFDAQAKENVIRDLELLQLPWEKQVEIMDAA